MRPQLIADGALQRSVEESLRRLQVDAVDLLLIHWPNPEVSVREIMRALSAAKRAGLTRQIGVSNFVIAKLEEAIEVSPEPIVTVQFEISPLSRPDPASRRGSPARPRDHSILPDRARQGGERSAPRGDRKAHGKSAVQVALRWLIQQDDVIAIPKTSNPERLKENFAVFDFRLTDAEMDQISRLKRPQLPADQRARWVPHWD